MTGLLEGFSYNVESTTTSLESLYGAGLSHSSRYDSVKAVNYGVHKDLHNQVHLGSPASSRPPPSSRYDSVKAVYYGIHSSSGCIKGRPAFATSPATVGENEYAAVSVEIDVKRTKPRRRRRARGTRDGWQAGLEDQGCFSGLIKLFRRKVMRLLIRFQTVAA